MSDKAENVSMLRLEYFPVGVTVNDVDVHRNTHIVEDCIPAVTRHCQ